MRYSGILKTVALILVIVISCGAFVSCDSSLDERMLSGDLVSFIGGADGPTEIYISDSQDDSCSDSCDECCFEKEEMPEEKTTDETADAEKPQPVQETADTSAEEECEQPECDTDITEEEDTAEIQKADIIQPETHPSYISPVFGSIESCDTKNASFYLKNINSGYTAPFAFFNGNTDIPYISLDDVSGILMQLYSDRPGYDLSVSEDGGVYTFERENGSLLTVNTSDSTFCFDSYSMFLLDPEKTNCYDLTPAGSDMFGVRERSLIRGSETVFSLSEYGIEIVSYEGNDYIPLQTFSDIFLSREQCAAVYNGKFASLVKRDTEDSYESLVPMLTLSAPGEKSSELAQFTYNELCLVLDSFYGFRQQNGIESFDEFFMKAQSGELLLSTDPAVSSAALSDIFENYLCDLSSLVVSPSAGDSDEQPVTVQSDAEYYGQAREKYYPDGIPGYEEKKDTAFITIDSFVFDQGRKNEQADGEEQIAEPETASDDTLTLIKYANQQIKRRKSPIKNVVIDLSNCTGGNPACEAALVSWVLGSAEVTVSDTLSGGRGSLVYTFDADGNGTPGDENDSIGDLRVFCIVSPVSGLKGNLPAMSFSASGRVSLIGTDIYGLKHSKNVFTLADGTLMDIPGRMEMTSSSPYSFRTSGDELSADFRITDTKNIYDRGALRKYINSLV